MKYVLPGRRYRNIKKQTVYQVFKDAHCSETMKNLVVYIAVDSDGNKLKHAIGLFCLKLASKFLQENVWVRPIGLFEEKFVEVRR